MSDKFSLKDVQGNNERYVVVTATSTHRMRYCIPASQLDTDDPGKMIEYAKDYVTCEEVKEFSQDWIGERIVDTFILDEERVLQLFDRDNDYLKEWPKEQKLEYIHKWEREDVA